MNELERQRERIRAACQLREAAQQGVTLEEYQQRLRGLAGAQLPLVLPQVSQPVAEPLAKEIEAVDRARPFFVPTFEEAIETIDDAISTYLKAFSADLEWAVFAITATEHVAASARAIGRLCYGLRKSQPGLDDPAQRATSWRVVGHQVVDMVRHEIAVARGRPELSQGAPWVGQ